MPRARARVTVPSIARPTDHRGDAGQCDQMPERPRAQLDIDPVGGVCAKGPDAASALKRSGLRGSEQQRNKLSSIMPNLCVEAVHTARNDLIFDDVLKALEAGRSPLVLTERKDHLDHLQGRFSRFARNLVVLKGGMSAAERKASEAALGVSSDKERLILATARYIGEGFDDQRLDTLFLTMPISWKRTLAQYVGRLHRQHEGKTEVLVVDYVHEAVPLLARMAAKRRAGYRALGYKIE
jgi:hypothetical protein